MMHDDARSAPTPEGSVQSVVRAFRMLEALAEVEGELPLAELAMETGLAQPTAHRLLKTMQNLGYVRQLESRSYGLGAGLIRLGQKATPQLAAQALPILQELEEFSHETANLVVLDGELVAYVAQIRSRHQMRMFTELGRRVSPHSAGAGKAILSTLPEWRVRDIVASTGLPRFTDTTLTTLEDLLADLRESRRRGYASDNGEHEVGVRCIAVPVPGSSHRAAISVSGPAARITDEVASRIVGALRIAVKRLAETLNVSRTPLSERSDV